MPGFQDGFVKILNMVIYQYPLKGEINEKIGIRSKMVILPKMKIAEYKQ